MNKNILIHDIKTICKNIAPLAPKFEDKTIVITGGMGFLGQYFASTFSYLNKHLLKKPCKLIIFDNNITGTNSIDDPSITYITKDICKELSIPKKVDFVIHAAGIASPYYYQQYPLETFETCTLGTKQTLELAKAHNAKYLYFSSSEIYGDPDPKHLPTMESYNGNVSTLGSRACYDIGKRAGETLCYIYNSTSNVNTSIIRPFNVFGPGMHERDYRVIPNFVANIIRKKPIKVYGDGKQTRTFCYISDAMSGFIRTMILGVSNQAYNIGNPSPEISMKDLVGVFSDITNEDLNFNIIEYPSSYPSDEPNRRCPDIKKATIHLGYMPEISLKEGLTKFYTWAKKHY